MVDVITSDPVLWADTMMREELGYGIAERDEVRAALTTLVVHHGRVPSPRACVYDLVAPGEVGRVRWSAVMTAVAFAAVGGMKSRFVDQSWWGRSTSCSRMAPAAYDRAFLQDPLKV